MQAQGKTGFPRRLESRRELERGNGIGEFDLVEIAFRKHAGIRRRRQ
jgi:hypothetical protein